MIAHLEFTTEASPRSYAARFGGFCAWRDEIAEAVAPARRPDASIWERSRAVRALERILVPRFREECARIAADRHSLDRRSADRLWAASQLMELLYEALVEDVRLPLRGRPFAAGLEDLLRALDHWCEEAELAAGLAERS